MTNPPAELALEVRNVDKYFGGTHAVRSANLTMVAGTVHAIVGENGAGKSTLVKIIAGVLPAGVFSGEIRVDGVRRTFSRLSEAEAAGIFLVPQEISVVSGMTIADNLFLNREPHRFGLVDYSRMWSDSAHVMRSLKIDAEPTTPMSSLSTGHQQLASIGRALSQGVKVLLLDEPTSSLTETESELLFDRVNQLRRLGVTVVYISHRLGEIVSLADHISVMRDGRVVAQIDATSHRVSPREVIRLMVGRDIDQMFPKSSAALGDVILEVEDFSVENKTPNRPDFVHLASLTVRGGEILGVFGAVGSGTNQLARAIFGAWSGRATGTVRVGGHDVKLGSPPQSIKHGMGYMSGDRKQGGIVPNMSVASNISLAVLPQVSGLTIHVRDEYNLVSQYVERLHIKIRSVDQLVAELSGGTQQKVLLARWLATSPRLLILDDPTRGIDVATRADIYAIMSELIRAGAGILLISSDLEEIMGMSDRIVVMAKGRIVGTWDRTAANQELILRAATGGSDA